MRKDRIDNPRYPHHIRIVRVNPSAGEGDDPNDPFADPVEPGQETEVVVYDGIGRSFTDTTTTGNDDVDTNKRKASIPVRFDKWEVGVRPLDGDTIYAASCGTKVPSDVNTAGILATAAMEAAIADAVYSSRISDEEYLSNIK